MSINKECSTRKSLLLNCLLDGGAYAYSLKPRKARRPLLDSRCPRHSPLGLDTAKIDGPLTLKDTRCPSLNQIKPGGKATNPLLLAMLRNDLSECFVRISSSYSTGLTSCAGKWSIAECPSPCLVVDITSRDNGKAKYLRRIAAARRGCATARCRASMCRRLATCATGSATSARICRSRACCAASQSIRGLARAGQVIMSCRPSNLAS